MSLDHANDLTLFKANGYLVQPSVVSAGDLHPLRQEADRLAELLINSSLANNRTSRRLDIRCMSSHMPVLRKIQPINDLSLLFTRLACDERILTTIQELMSDNPKLMEEKLIYKQQVPHLPAGISIAHAESRFFKHNDWAYHQEQAYPPDIISAALFLDDAPLLSGPLYVWPGTHKKHLKHERTDNSYIVPDTFLAGRIGLQLIVSAGAIIFFHCLLVHCSAPNRSEQPRRAIIFSYVPEGKHMPIDARNGPLRLAESPFEWNYQMLKNSGRFQDCFEMYPKHNHSTLVCESDT
jgi:Phytanoyl-CoA dioxygenase (PhyH)